MNDSKYKEGMSESGKSNYGYYNITCVRGASHVKHNIPCQDAYDFFNDGGSDHPFILAIADGHGDKRYDMSQYGSELASTVAVELIREFYEELKDSNTLLFRTFRDDFPKQVIREWRKKVLNHANDYGLDTKNRSEVYTRYGTTLLVALVTKDEILFGQLGDGDVVLVDGQGNCTIPFQQEDDLLGSATYSLSSTEANRFWKAARMDFPAQTQFLALSTDGLSNCFEDERNFHQFMSSLYSALKESGNVSEYNRLSDILFDYSMRGSGDDITLAAIELQGSRVNEPLNTIINDVEDKVTNQESLNDQDDEKKKKDSLLKKINEQMDSADRLGHKPLSEEESINKVAESKQEETPIIHFGSRQDKEGIKILFNKRSR
ncbi:PP2C family serine/threonine-protein phosphatase [Bacillus sp. X1(2014)]|uniref:PP2C family serine/threonine-protein phosphatase n=1 Tax=Bacillus sp. X1(2014) TaxID=1565991 RepID=UPI0011A9C64A|nr:PP2C family serine/threonine-protein phosphatase [Bacillus sp. X1(2014)]